MPKIKATVKAKAQIYLLSLPSREENCLFHFSELSSSENLYVPLKGTKSKQLPVVMMVWILETGGACLMKWDRLLQVQMCSSLFSCYLTHMEVKLVFVSAHRANDPLQMEPWLSFSIIIFYCWHSSSFRQQSTVRHENQSIIEELHQLYVSI